MKKMLFAILFFLYLPCEAGKNNQITGKRQRSHSAGGSIEGKAIKRQRLDGDQERKQEIRPNLPLPVSQDVTMINTSQNNNQPPLLNTGLTYKFLTTYAVRSTITSYLPTFKATHLYRSDRKMNEIYMRDTCKERVEQIINPEGTSVSITHNEYIRLDDPLMSQQHLTWRKTNGLEFQKICNALEQRSDSISNPVLSVHIDDSEPTSIGLIQRLIHHAKRPISIHASQVALNTLMFPDPTSGAMPNAIKFLNNIKDIGTISVSSYADCLTEPLLQSIFTFIGSRQAENNGTNGVHTLILKGAK
jgi:hypothetical protein